MKLFVMMSILLLTGCGGYINQESAENAIALCEPNGGLDRISIYANFYAICNNGAEFKYQDWVTE